jgi:DNA-binding MarR family transcriptional regulator
MCYAKSNFFLSAFHWLASSLLNLNKGQSIWIFTLILLKGIGKSKGRFSMEEKVLTAMKKVGKPVRPGDIAKDLGVESKDVSNAIKALKAQGKVISPKRCFYEPASGV